jgi:hypothetical protein
MSVDTKKVVGHNFTDPTIERTGDHMSTAMAEQQGLIGTLSPWGLMVFGVVLAVLAGVAFWFNRKVLQQGSCLLDIVGIVCGLGGVVALLVGIFGR